MKKLRVFYAHATVVGLLLLSFSLCGMRRDSGSQSKRRDSISRSQHLRDKMHEFKEQVKHEIESIDDHLSGRKIGRIQEECGNRYESDEATVRVGDCVSQGESEFLIKKLIVVRAVCEQLMGCKLEEKDVPRIVIAGSGVGVCGMLGFLGGLSGAHKIGLLPFVSHVATVSSSTWSVAPLISLGLSIDEFKRQVIEHMSHSLFELDQEEIRLIIDMLEARKKADKVSTLANLHGALLANRLLADEGDNRQKVYLSSQARMIDPVSFPYPIYMALDDTCKEKYSHPAWLQCTPHEAGSMKEQVYVPMWAWGYHFKNGKSLNKHDDNMHLFLEETVGDCMGAFGFVPVEGDHRMYDRLTSYLGYEKGDSTNSTLMEDAAQVILFAQVPHYMYGMKGHSDGVQKVKDAGFVLNIALPPLLERGADIYFIVDSSDGKMGSEMEKGAEYAHENGYPFPFVGGENLGKETMSVFKDDHNSQVPVVVYMPHISDPELLESKKNDYSEYIYLKDFDMEKEKNKGCARTNISQYDQKDSRRVIDLMEFNMCANQDEIFDLIKEVITRKMKA